MLHDLAVVIQAENINARPITVARPLLQAMEDDILALRDHSREVDALARIFPRHARKVVDESLLAVGHAGIVLNIDVPDVSLDRFGGLALIELQVVESRYGLFVLFQPFRLSSLQS